MSVVFTDTFTVGADVNIESYPGTPDYARMNGSAGNVVVNAANDRVQRPLAGGDITFVRCLDASMPTGNQSVTTTGAWDTGSTSALPCVRCQAGSFDCYTGWLNFPGGTLEIYRVSAGPTYTFLAGGTTVPGAGTYTATLQAVGTGAQVDLDFTVQGVGSVQYSDTAGSRLTSGTPGFEITNGTGDLAWLDNFSVDDLIAGVAAGPMFRGS